MLHPADLQSLAQLPEPLSRETYAALLEDLILQCQAFEPYADHVNRQTAREIGRLQQMVYYLDAIDMTYGLCLPIHRLFASLDFIKAKHTTAVTFFKYRREANLKLIDTTENRLLSLLIDASPVHALKPLLLTYVNPFLPSRASKDTLLHMLGFAHHYETHCLQCLED